MSAIVLPRIARVQLTGFAPLFNHQVEFKIPDKAGSFLVLGGNGLGKTSILQSVIFAIAGIADNDLQDARENSRFKWDMSYFKERVTEPKNAEVVVEFFLGETQIQVRRGLDSDRVRGVRVNSAEWVNSKDAAGLFEKTILRASGCSSLRDFRYLVHRLCYLPESRRNIVWDPDAQLAIFLFVCAEAGVEAGIRSKVAQWRKAYGDMRHTHVSITHIKTRIAEAEQRQAAAKLTQARKSKDPILLPQNSSANKFDEVKQSLERTAAEITKLNSDITARGRALQVLSDEIEREEITFADAEEKFVLHALRDIEKGAQALALQKLLVLHQCPYCTQISEPLAAKASNLVSSGHCPICALDHVSNIRPSDIADLKEALAVKVRKRSSLQEELKLAQRELENLRNKSSEFEAALGQESAHLPRVRREDRIGLSEEPEDLRKMLDAYENEHRQLERRSVRIKQEMEREYAAIEQAQAKRYTLIEQRVAKYASEFLGIDCTFARVAGTTVDKDTPFAFDVLVPSFAGKARTESHQCSESQAFFLDIAFRMAVLDVVRALSGQSATFICETPENALDMAYAENVAKMFAKFSEAKCFCLMTANIQFGGVAEPLLRAIATKGEREKRILNLLQYAQLSEVQEKALPRFTKQLAKLIGN